MLIFIDAGHGGLDSGEIGRAGLVEKNIVLNLSLKEKIIFEKFNHTVVMAREADEYVPLINRVEKANDIKADVYISNHMGSGGARGIEVLHSVAGGKSKELAEEICKNVSKVGLLDRGVKFKRGICGDYNIVIRETKMPSVIINYGFIDSVYDAEFLKDDYFLERIASEVVKSVLKIFNEINGNTSALTDQDSGAYDVLLEGTSMVTAYSLEDARRYVDDAVKNGLCKSGSVINRNNREVLYIN
jgi:N-acetylmuramoyl-L-alanine amidase